MHSDRRTVLIRSLFTILAALVITVPAAAESGRETILLDDGWRFALGHAADPAKDFDFGAAYSYASAAGWGGAVRPGFDDGAWRTVDLPHDWAVELPFVQAPFTFPLMDHGFKPLGRVFPETSIGWYRRHFAVPKSDEGRRFRIDFNGAFRDCHVWLNGILLGRHEGGYDPFGFDATDLVNCGGDNVLVVRVDATHNEGWFYEGAGLYRHVRLTKTAPVHIPVWGTYVTAQVEGTAATLTIETEIANETAAPAKIGLKSAILDPSGKPAGEIIEAARAVGPFQTAVIRQSVRLSAPYLWTLEKPALYSLASTVLLDNRPTDIIRTRFGVRSIRFDKDKGFFLNGTRVQIQGVCNHQDHAGVGAALPDRLQFYRVAKLKEMGVNAYRTSHNPPTPELLDACDELGLLVMDETRLFSSSVGALDQLRRMVRRDRNHPSIILWSIGNEEGVQAAPVGRRIAETMVRAIKALDTTRPTTYGSNSGAFEGINQAVDVRGFNYHLGEIDAYHAAHPDQPIFGSEIASTLTTRGEYADDKGRGYMASYDKSCPRWGELAREWMIFYAARPWLAGAFVWTGFDYRGEPTPYVWPCISSHFGILDTCGFPKDLFWYYKSWWTNEPVLHIFPHWNWKGREGQAIEVWAYSNMDEVRLTLNGKDLGTKKIPRLGRAEWSVPFEQGRLEAVGFRNGKEALREAVETTGPPARLTLTADRAAIAADGRDLSIVTIGVLDAKGRPMPIAADEVSFDLSGPGRIIGVGNGDPSSHEPDVFLPSPPAKAGGKAVPPQWKRRLFNGLAQVLVQAGRSAGTLTLRATAAGLAPIVLNIRTAKSYQ
jgi:beta-galactosidase